MARTLKRGLRVLALFDLGEPVTMEQDLGEDLKSEAWKTEADVLAALGESRRVLRAPRGRAQRLLGRVDEIAVLEASLRALFEGRPAARVIEITGPSGAGKTRLLLEGATHIAERRLAECSPELLAVRVQSANSLMYDGNYTGARRISEQALAACEKCLGADHSRTATVMHNIGLLEPSHFVMERKMMLSIKQRAEALAGHEVEPVETVAAAAGR